MKKELQKRLISSIVLIPISFLFIFQGSIFFIFFLSLLFVITSYEWVKMSKSKLFLKYFGITFLFFSFYSAYYIRESTGLHFFLFLILICISTDIGGFIFGKVFKGPKLTKISPNKTFSGSIGSFLLSLAVGFVFLKYTRIEFLGNDYLKIIFSIFLVSLISQLGDLIISYYKRKAKLKNTGNILPGHGGLLDRIDGMIFVIPTTFILTSLLK